MGQPSLRLAWCHWFYHRTLHNSPIVYQTDFATKQEHPDGSIIHIRPNGEIVRTGPKIRDMNGKTYRRRYDQYGNKIQFISGANTHSTGENLIL